MHLGNLLLKFWFLALVSATNNDSVVVEELPSNTGLYANPIGHLKDITSHWTLIIAKDIYPLFENYYHISALLNRLKTLENKLGTTHHNYIHSLTLQTELTKINRDLKTIKNIFPLHRNKRGWVNIIGTGLHYVFGTMDADDEERIDNVIKQLQESNKATLALVDESVHITKDTIRNFNQTLEALSLNEQNINQNFEKVTNQLNRVTNNTLANEFHLRILNIAMIISDIIQELNRDTTEIKNYLLFSKIGILPPDLIGPKFMNHLMDVQNHITDKELPLDLKNGNMFKTLSLCKLGIFLKDYSIIFKINIPLISKTKFTLYQLFPVPVPSKRTPNHYNILIPNFPYLAVDNSRSHFAKFHFISQFIHLDNDYFGQNLEIFSVTNSKSCEVELLLHHNWDHTCDGITSPIIEETVSKLDENKWLVLLTKPLKFTYKCKNVDIREVNIKQNSLLIVQDICSGFLSNGIKINVNQNQTSNFNMSAEHAVIPEDCCIENEKQATQLRLPPLKMASLNQEEMVLNKYRLENLEEKVYNEKMRPLLRVTSNSWFWPIVSTLGSVIIIVTMCYCCCPGCLNLFRPGLKKLCCDPGSVCIRINNINKPLVHRRNSYREPQAVYCTAPALTSPGSHLEETETDLTTKQSSVNFVWKPRQK